MKIYYLNFTYRKEFTRGFKEGIELNFDSTLRFELVGKTLNRIATLGEIPQGFFSVVNNGDKSVVDSVSAVVGKNGAGKTSIAEVIKDIKEETPQLSKFESYVIIYSRHKSEKIFCDSNISGLILPDGIKDSGRNGDVIWPRPISISEIPLVYITPHFTPYPLVEPVNYISTLTDLSPVGIMKKDVENYYNPTAGQMREILWRNPIDTYRTLQTKWMLSFVDATNKLPHRLKGEYAECSPQGVSVAISKVVFQKLSNKEPAETDDGVLEILNKVNDAKNDFVVNAFYAYSGLYLIDNHRSAIGRIGIAKSGENSDPRVETAETAWKEYLQYGNGLRDLCLSKERLDVDDIKSFFEGAAKYPDATRATFAEKCFLQLIKVLDIIRKAEGGSNEILGPQCLNRIRVVGTPDTRITITTWHSPTYLKEVLELVDLHFKCKSILDFLDFDTSPRMSSGERSYFNTWGRLYHHYRESADFINRYRNGIQKFDIADPDTWPEQEDCVVFFDEAETTMHPDWQRQLVKETIWFFEAFVPWVHPHIIFATHSPILLSDIPSGNVVFLEKSGACIVAKNEDRRRTFAANVFDLYRDSFFMEHGTIGAFADIKVRVLLEKLRSLRTQSEDRSLPVGLGDAIKLAKLIADPFISRLTWRQLDALVEEDGDRSFNEELKDFGVANEKN